MRRRPWMCTARARQCPHPIAPDLFTSWTAATVCNVSVCVAYIAVCSLWANLSCHPFNSLNTKLFPSVSLLVWMHARVSLTLFRTVSSRSLRVSISLSVAVSPSISPLSLWCSAHQFFSFSLSSVLVIKYTSCVFCFFFFFLFSDGIDPQYESLTVYYKWPVYWVISFEQIHTLPLFNINIKAYFFDRLLFSPVKRSECEWVLYLYKTRAVGRRLAKPSYYRVLHCCWEASLVSFI